MKQEEIEKMAENNKHIPTSEIEKDIIDTQREISQMEIKAEHLKATPIGMRGARWDHMRADVLISGIERRKEFIKKLKAILEFRKRKNSLDEKN